MRGSRADERESKVAELPAQPGLHSLAEDSASINDILSASATGANQVVSLYLMATSSSLGMTIFTGGQQYASPS